MPDGKRCLRRATPTQNVFLDARIIVTSKNGFYTGFDKTRLGDNVTYLIQF
ncbi:hypothetical protein [Nostoc commune]|uniref:hypothetical protein n=1 Tax=Nostoc commune TaxID=1178 RepID=UPI00207326F5|nr:hypothetical protein [Nostoc commune]